jgi:hypothetical protein
MKKSFKRLTINFYVDVIYDIYEKHSKNNRQLFFYTLFSQFKSTNNGITKKR